MDQHAHPADVVIDWEVIGVFDPDGETPDFSYTVGLHARGLSELHLWARPSEGVDPGHDWAFSERDRGNLLNRWARHLCSGALRSGDTWTEEFDFGLARATFTVGDPVTPAVVDAFAVGAGATVLPVRWSLERDLPGVGTASNGVTSALVTGWTAAVTASSGAGPGVDDGTAGPAGCLLAAVRAAVLATAPRELSEFFYGAMVVDHGTPMGSRHVTAGAVAYGRVAGRAEAVSRARSLAQEDADRLLGDPEVGRELMTSMQVGPHDEQMRGGIRSIIEDALGAAYACAVLVDVLPRSLLVAGLAPVLTAVAPVPQLQFDLAVTDQVRVRLGDLDRWTLAHLASTPFDPEAVAEVLTTAILAGADAPPWDHLLAGPPTAAAARMLGPQWARSLRRTLTDLARAIAYPEASGAERLLDLLPPARTPLT